ncbi:hypothetical protein [Actinomycetospora sp. TBRC 11914]|uniref:hypothetical protein n=1 Tax=Actinomycetospora sp. TBRC 11914 TaxID=2729387 RepID=UPI00145EFFD9|nr:hypothetical protein [Actinomycetospora sp. TBRC 11914]NMO92756.1 hypothetical protein [Actinomycetospora sp. TBRC 11914]
MRDLLWSTFLPWVRVPGTPTYRRLAAEGVPPDLPGYRLHDAGHEPPGATADETRARSVSTRILAAEQARVAEITALLDRLGLDHGPDGEAWDAIGAWLAGRPADHATPSLQLDLGLLLGRRLIEARPGAAWEADDLGVQAYPWVVLGTEVIAVPLQAVERGGTEPGVALRHALDAQRADPEAEFVAHLREVLDGGGEPTAEDLEWMLAESGLESLPDLPDDVRDRLPVPVDPPS